MIAESELMLGSSRARGFHTPTYPYIPGGTLRGALAGAWIREWGRPDDSLAPRFTAEVLDLRVGPGTARGAVQVPLDHQVCKYTPQPACTAVAVPQSGSANQCPTCGGRLEASKGGWTHVARQRTTRTSLTDDETALEGHLFSRDALARHHVFTAVAWGDLRWLTNISTIWVGGRRSVGGRVTVTAQPQEAPDPAVTGSTLKVRLESPGIFLDRFGGNSLRPTDADLRAVFGSDAAELATSWVRSEVVGGWNAAGGLPKSSDLAAVTGSVYELQFTRPVSAADVLAVERAGLGVRRADGFGWVSARPWTPPSAIESAEVDHPDAPGTPAITLAKRAAGFDQGFVRQLLGWVRAGIETQDLTGAAAYNGLVPEGRHLVDAALAFTGEQRRQLIIALEVRS